MRSRLGTVLILCAAFTTVPHGQQPPRAAPPPDVPAAQTFRSSVDFVQVDVVATDAAGTPVTDLTAGDFEVFENGKPQVIQTFMPVTIPIERAAPLPAGAEADVQTNVRREGHVYLFVLAGTGEAMALRTRYLVHKFVDEHFGDNDIGAVVTGRTFPGDRQDFTGNRRLLLAAVDRFEGSPLDIVELGELMEMTAAIPGARKVVMWFGDPKIDPYEFIDYHGGVFATRVQEAAHAAMAAATRGNIRFYLFDPAGLALSDQTGAKLAMHNPAEEVQERNNYRALAAMTGGVAAINTNLFEEAFERMLSETSRYYLLGFESTTKKSPGRYIRLEVKAKRPGLTVRARTGYLEYMKYNERRTYVPPDRTPIEEALANPLSTPGVGMRVTAAPYRKSNREATVALAIDLDASNLAFTEKDGRYIADLEIRHLATDADHRIYPLQRSTSTVTLDAAEYARVQAGGLRVFSQLFVPKGRYQIRVATASGTQRGSVVYDLEVPDFAAGPLSMSGVAISAMSTADTMTLRPSDTRGGSKKPKQCRASSCEPAESSASALTSWRAQSAAAAPFLSDVLPSAPTTVREFGGNDTLVLFTELYDNNRNLKKSVPYDLTVRAQLENAAGQVVRTVSDVRPSQEPLRPSGGHGFTLRVPLMDVSPGAYVLRIQGRSANDPEQSLTRSIPLRVR